jgi:hypothetical protein
MGDNETQILRFLSCHPMRFKRKATGEKVKAIKSVTSDWDFDEFKQGDFVVLDGQRLYRCPPIRFHLIFEKLDE